MEDRKIYISQYKLPIKFNTETSKEVLKVEGIKYFLAKKSDLDTKAKYHKRNLHGSVSDEYVTLYY